MGIVNSEIKASISDIASYHKLLIDLGADFKGLDKQIDTYFDVPSGRLKLRRGTIENNLIYYDRKEVKGVKTSFVKLYKPSLEAEALKEILSALHGILVEVIKQRRIYFIDNVKFHLDDVEGLGKFIEIEAIDVDGIRNISQLENQCNEFINLLGLQNAKFLDVSYSDLLLKDENI